MKRLSPKLVCVACQTHEVRLGEETCAECRAMWIETGYPELAGPPYCHLCAVNFPVDEHGRHTNETGGYVGRCEKSIVPQPLEEIA